MMKKMIRPITLLLAISSANIFAFSAYVGADGGISSMNINQNMNYTMKVSGDAKSNQRQFQSYAGSMNGYVGVGQAFKRLYIGLEANYNYSNPAATASIKQVSGFDKGVSVTEKLGSSFGAALMTGWFINNTNFIFLKGGAQMAHFSTDSKPTNPESKFPHSADILGYSGSYSKNVLGLSLGVGFESYFSHNLSLRVEYNYTQYQNINLSQGANVDPTIQSASFKYAPSSNTVLAGITWHLPFGHSSYPKYNTNNVMLAPGSIPSDYVKLSN